MSKFAVIGRDSGELLNRLSTANVDGDVGVITYTQWLNESVSCALSLPTLSLIGDNAYFASKLFGVPSTSNEISTDC